MYQNILSLDHDLPNLTREQCLQVLLWTRRSATLQSLTSSCAATLASRAQAVLLTTMSCGMRTTSQLMHCRPLPTTSATRKLGHSYLLVVHLDLNSTMSQLLKAMILYNCLNCLCSYARCTRSVSIGKPLSERNMVESISLLPWFMNDLFYP